MPTGYNLQPFPHALVRSVDPKNLFICPLDYIEQNDYIKIFYQMYFGKRGMGGESFFDNFFFKIIFAKQIFDFQSSTK